MSPFGQKLLSRSSIWASDGTFHSAPPPFKQLYVIAALSPTKRILPAAYILLQDKHSESYTRMWEEIKNQLPEDCEGPKTLKIDFELAACNTFQTFFPDPKVLNLFAFTEKHMYVRTYLHNFRKTFWGHP